MSGRKKAILLVLLGLAVFIPLSLFVLLYVDPFVAVLVSGVAVVIFLSLMAGRKRHHRDALYERQARAAERGDQSAFLHDRNDNITF